MLVACGDQPAAPDAARTRAPSVPVVESRRQPPLAHCPGPCALVSDIDADGRADGAVTVTYEADGFPRELRWLGDHGGVEWSMRIAPTSGTDRITLEERTGSGRIQFRREETVTAEALPRLVEGLVLRGHGREPWFDSLQRAVPEGSETVQSSSVGPGGFACDSADVEVRAQPRGELLASVRFRCDGTRGLVSAAVLDADGREVGATRADYSCWPAATPCPRAPPVTLPSAQTTVPSVIRATRADVALLVDVLRGNPQSGARVRVIPRQENGRLVALMLYAVRSDDPLSRLGIRNGDGVASIADVPITVDGFGTRAELAVAQARGHLDIVVIRGGQSATLRLTLER